MKTIKKLAVIIMTVASIALSALAFAACDGSSGPQTEFKPTGTSVGTLVMGFDAEYPPYGYLDSEKNEYAGFDIELAKVVCEKMNYTLVLKPIDWDAKDTELESGNITCIWSGFTIEGRENDYAWTVPYSNSQILVMVKGDSITTLADLAGKSVAVQAESSGESALKDNTTLVASLKGGTYTTKGSYMQIFNDLESGAVDAIVIDSGVAKELMTGKTEYSTLNEVLSQESYGVGFAKTNTTLCKLVSDTMESVDAATITEIATKYGVEKDIVLGKND